MTIDDLKESLSSAGRAKGKLLDIAEGGPEYGTAKVFATQGIEELSTTLWILQKALDEWERDNPPSN